MAFVDQAEFGPGTGTCFSACLASVLGRRAAAVPSFARPNDSGLVCWQRVEKWLAARGYGLVLLVGDPPLTATHQEVISIANGRSPRGTRHSVLWRGGTVIHDPHPSRAGLVGAPDSWALIILQPPDVLPLRLGRKEA